MPILLLEKFESKHPDFAAPLTHNGEPMELVSVEMNGSYLVVRYFNEVPVAGPKMERYLVDLYCNSDGREAYRLTAKLTEPPPPSPAFRERLGLAWRLVFPQ